MNAFCQDLFISLWTGHCNMEATKINANKPPIPY